jgi:SAM-dependent methyltransferase
MMNRYSAIWFELFLEPIQPIQTESEISFITRHLPNPPYSRILDLCCGLGRHARLLADKKYQVTGVDFNKAALDKATSLSNEKVVYRELDMRQLAELPDTFDAVINLWQSFGYFDETINADILRQIGYKLYRRGRLILDVYHRGFFEQHQGIRQLESNGVTVTETKLMKGNRLSIELDYEGRERERFEWQLYSPDEIGAQAKEYSLVPVIICTGFNEMQSASDNSPRMQIVFEKT